MRRPVGAGTPFDRRRELGQVTPVFGRDRELAVADAFLHSVLERFGVLVVEGEAGIGKTTLWREAVRRAEQRGLRILACSPVASETKLALSGLADLLDHVPEDAVRLLPDPQRQALDVAILRASPGQVPPEPRALAMAARSLLAELSARGPLLVAIDDVHWLDGPSARIVEFSLRRLTDRPIGWLFARRVDEPTGLASSRLVPPESMTTVSVGPLSLAALHHVLRPKVSAPLTRSTLVRIHEASGGNPLYALEILRALEESGALLERSVPVPRDVSQVLNERLRRLPAEARDALLMASALSQPTTALVDERCLEPAEDAELVQIDPLGRISFRHPLFASAVYNGASRSRRRELHRRLVEVVSDPEEQARHLALGARHPDEAIARRLEEGAALARSRGSWDSAAELLERAAALTPLDRPAQAARRMITAAEHHAHAGNRPRARILVEDVLAGPLPEPLRAGRT